MAKRKFRKTKQVFGEIKAKKDERLFEIEYLEKLKRFITKIKKGLKKWQESKGE